MSGRMVFGAAMVLFTACGGGATGIPVSGAVTSIAGTGPDDLWNLHTMEHWDGKAWTKVTVDQSGISHESDYVAAEKGVLWASGGEGGKGKVWRVDTTGARIDVTAGLPDTDAPIRVSSCRGTAVATVVSGGGGGYATRRARLFRREGDGWTELPAPAAPGWVAGALVTAGGQVWARTATNAPRIGLKDAAVQNNERALSAGLMMLKGDRWVPLLATKALQFRALGELTPASPSFPADDLWLDSLSVEGHPSQAYFDGTVARPVAIPMPHSTASRVFFGSHGLTAVFEGPRNPIDPGPSWTCDGSGECARSDAAVTVETTWFKAEWSGSDWVNYTELAKGQGCSGAGCIYRGEPPGIVGELDDGTVVLRAVEDDKVRLALIKL